MSQIAKIEPKAGGARGLSAVMAERFQMEPQRFVEAIKETVIKGPVTDGQLAAFLMVAHEYGLNPLTKEVYAFPSNGGIQPIVSIDGWMKLINSHPQFDGMAFQDHVGDDGKLDAVTCRIYRKDRSHPTEATEYMAECARATEPWKKWPRRMLRHKAAIQCARYAFSFAGIMDDDDFDRMKDITPSPTPTIQARLQAAQEAPQMDQDEREGFDAGFVIRETEGLSASHPAPINGEIVDETGELFDDPDSGAVPSPEDEDAGEVNPPPASPASEPNRDLLKRVFQRLYAAAGPDKAIVKAVGESLRDELAAESQATRDKAKTIWTQVLMFCAKEIEKGDLVEYLAGVVGVDPKELLDGATEPPSF